MPNNFTTERLKGALEYNLLYLQGGFEPEKEVLLTVIPIGESFKIEAKWIFEYDKDGEACYADDFFKLIPSDGWEQFDKYCQDLYENINRSKLNI